ncbi:TetR/AcrR family transcriptional regulator [Leifsonia poae]|uniref:TetR/AcrR family transcriptional regulator n=1 Tax=Leifsonia poae TaxID=110933 RepID=UPI003D686D15
MARRGAYAKGVAKREEILEAALDVIAREGWHGASVKELAESVGLSQAGLLHYFGSKDELFTAILRKRDEVDSRRFPQEQPVSADRLREGFVSVVRHNAEVPGLVQLFSRLAVEGGDPSHPAHEYFAERSATLRALFTQVFAQQQADGAVTRDVDPETLARLVQAVSDGLQLQWLQDPSVDMAATVDAMFTLLAAHSPGPHDI